MSSINWNKDKYGNIYVSTTQDKAARAKEEMIAKRQEIMANANMKTLEMQQQQQNMPNNKPKTRKELEEQFKAQKKKYGIKKEFVSSNGFIRILREPLISSKFYKKLDNFLNSLNSKNIDRITFNFINKNTKEFALKQS